MERLFRIVAIALGTLVLVRAAPAPAFDPERLAYNLRTTVQSYETIGRTNTLWDAEARRCLTAFARLRSVTNSANQSFFDELGAVLPLLRAKGCDDPMVRYLEARFILVESGSQDKVTAAFQRAARELQDSQYPSLRKFYASMWAYRTTQTSDAKSPMVTSLLSDATSELAKALADRSMPIQEADEATDMLVSSFHGSNTNLWNCYRILEAPLTNVWKGTAFAECLKGRAYVSAAWLARGSGYADTVSKEGGRLFAERLRIAEEALESAWKLNPTDLRVCLAMAHVELGQGKGLARLNTWFERGMNLDPANYELCRAKIEYLRPRWYGSRREMIAFGRECTLNTNYRGSVRLWLADAHYEFSREIQDEQERRAYWRQKDVWPDVKLTFDQFFKLYPTETGYRHNYARYAYRCGQWNEFLNQVKLFPSTNHVYFGGPESFQSMVDYAKQHSKDE